MSIRIIKPMTITTSMVVASSMAEDSTAAWSAGTSYATGAEAHDPLLHRRYRSLADNNLGNSPSVSSTQWLDIGPTDRWAPFDGAIGTACAQAGSISYTLRPGVAVTAVALFGLSGAVSARVIMVDAGVTVYDREFSLSAATVSDWWEYFTAPFVWRDRLLVDDLPLYANATLQVIVAGNGTDSVSVGAILPGAGYAFSQAMAGVKAGWADYSRAIEDDFGVVSLVQRARVPKLDVTFQVPPDDFGRVWAALESLASIPVVVSVSEDPRHDALTFLGWFREPQLDLRSAALYFCSIAFRGLA